jgi:hypothetical protein
MDVKNGDIFKHSSDGTDFVVKKIVNEMAVLESQGERRQMAKMELTHVEIEMLREILRKQFSELTLETAFTHRKDFHEFLKRRKEFMEGLIERLEREFASGKKEVVEIDRFRKVDILQGPVEGELESIAQYFEEETFSAGVTLCEEGTNADRPYVLEQRKVSVNSRKGGQYDIDLPGRIVGWSFLMGMKVINNLAQVIASRLTGHEDPL